MLKAACCVLLLGAWFASACGGRSTTEPSVDGSSGSPSSSGASGSDVAGASGAGTNTVGASGTPAGGAGAAGVGGDGVSGALNVCGGVDCPNIVCPANTAPVVQPGACCTTCQSTCKPACVVPCPVDTHPVAVPGACCASCEPNISVVNPPCSSGELTYAADRAQMLDKYSHGCVTDQDCVAIGPSNRCEAGCAGAAVLGIEADNFNSNLKSEADTQCSSCPPMGSAKCVAPPPPVCLSNACQLPVK